MAGYTDLSMYLLQYIYRASDQSMLQVAAKEASHLFMLQRKENLDWMHLREIESSSALRRVSSRYLHLLDANDAIRHGKELH